MSLKTKLREHSFKRKLKDARYPVHGRTLGYLDTPREPFTWFVCNNGHLKMGAPWEEPKEDCRICGFNEAGVYLFNEGEAYLSPNVSPPFMGWKVADSAAAFSATVDACGPNRDGRAVERYRRTQA